MRHNINVFQVISALFVLGISGLLFWALVGVLSPNLKDMRTWKASFESVGASLKKGSPVRINGVVVGYVKGVSLNRQTYGADVSFSVEKDIALYDDVRAFIDQPLMGEATLCISPGVSGEALDPKDPILNTDAPQSFLDLIGQYIMRTSRSEKDAEEGKTPM